MPELPEVETVARGLRKTVQGQRVTGLTIYRTDLRKSIPVEVVTKVLEGNVVESIYRRSKYLGLQTANGHCA